MNNKNIADQLIRGSANIDQMEREIHQIITMILGVIHYRRTLPVNMNKTFNFESCQWNFQGQIEKMYKMAIEIDCKVKSGPEQCASVRGYYYSTNLRQPMLNSEVVQVMHESLPALVKCMFDEYPGLEKSLEHITKAADKF